jgi:long-subunit fatty acid transport protein
VTGTAPLGALGGAVRVGDDTVVGFGAYTPLLNGMDFTDSLSQEPFELEGVFDSTFYTLVFNASVGHRLNADWSIGGGLNVIHGSLSLTNAQRLRGPGSMHIEQSIDLSGDGTGMEWLGGVTFRALEGLRIGGVYRSGAAWNIAGRSRVELTGLLDSEGSFVFPFRHPTTFAIGVAWDGQPSWTVTFDWQRTLWQSFTNGIEFEDPQIEDIPDTADWRDSNRFRVGFRYRLSASSSLAGGYYYAGRAVSQPISVTDGDLSHQRHPAHRRGRVGSTLSLDQTRRCGTRLTVAPRRTGVRYGW